MGDPTRYGSKYFCVGLSDKKGTEVYAHADEVKVEASGALLLIGSYRDEDKAAGAPHVNVAFGPGQWAFVYAASVIDGSAVAVEHWRGQIAEAEPRPKKGK